jgi:type II secretory pathway pseudopilin PulG
LDVETVLKASRGADISEVRMRGTTILELMLVVVIIGVIAAIAIPRMSNAQERAMYTSTWATYRNLAAGVEAYRSVWKSLPQNVNHAISPPGMASFLHPRVWTRRPSIGGAWDWNGKFDAAGNPSSLWVGLPPNIGIFRNGDSRVMARTAILDRMFDNNNINTGQLRRLQSDHHCYILDE